MNLADYKLHIIVEDDGLKYFLDETLDITLLPTKEINVVKGGGWTNLFIRYEELLNKGVDADRIIPILDGNAINIRNPNRNNQVLENPNLIRLYRDLEYAYDNWMIVEAILNEGLLYNFDKSPLTFQNCMNIVLRSRGEAAKTHQPLYSILEGHLKDEYERSGGERSAYNLTGKVPLAQAVAKIAKRSKIFSEEIGKVVNLVQKIATMRGIGLLPSRAQEIEANGLRGQLLIVTSGELHILDLATLGLNKFENHPPWRIGKASWSPNGDDIACEAGRKGDKSGTLVMTKQGKEKNFLMQSLTSGPVDDPCWYKDGKSILVRTENGICRKRIASKDWPLLLQTSARSTVNQCVSIKNRVAVNIYDKSAARYSLNISKADGSAPFEKVKDITETSGGISWSPDGKQIAFVNQFSQDMGAVYVYDLNNETSAFVTSHDGFPQYVCFSPDGKFIIYTWRQAKGTLFQLRAVDVATGKIIVLINSMSDLRIACHAWKI